MPDPPKDPLLTRRAYKGQLTALKTTMKNYRDNPELLTQDGAEQDLIACRDMVSRVERKFESTQSAIIKAAKTHEARVKEEEELTVFLDDCASLEMSYCKLIAQLPKDEAAGAQGGSVDAAGLTQVINLMSQQLKEQRQQRLSEETKLASILSVQREEIQKMLEASRNDLALNASLGNADGEGSMEYAKLEPIKIPTFGGAYCDWPTFKNLFVSSVDKNARLTKAQKMHYLRTNTVGEALALFSSLAISEENYSVAWSRLVKRYDDKMMIVTAHMDKFMNQQTITRPSAVALRKLQSSTTQALEAINALEVPDRDPWLIHWTLNHVDHQTRTLWSEKKPETVPTWEDFDDFLNTRCRNLEATISLPPPSKSNQRQTVLHINDGPKRENCKFCNLSPHRLYRCKKFLGLQPKKRLETLKTLKLCQNCIIDNHDVRSCSFQSCKVCNQRHNHLIHDAFASPTNTTALSLVETPPPPHTAGSSQLSPFVTTLSSLNCSGKSGGVLLATAMVLLLGDNTAIECRALLDPGSQLDIISASMCRKLKLRPTRADITIEGVGSISHSGTQETQVQLQVQGEKHMLDCVVMDKVVGPQPNWTIDIRNIPIPPHLTLADPTWFQTQQVDLLIGGRHVWKFLGNEKIILGDDLPMLFESSFGWLVVGPCHSQDRVEVGSCNLTTMDSIERTYRKFFEIEDIPRDAIVHADHEDVETLFSSTTSREADGRYMVMLPLKDNVQELDNNRGVAVRQLSYLKRKLEKNPQLGKDYDGVFKEYLNLNIIERVPPEDMSKPSYYFPHHGVIKKDATTTKLRVVFNASSRTKSGLSLNDCMKVCPVVQPTLLSILWRFRMHEIALTCDIVKMYLQVLMHPSHRDYHRFVWSENNETVDYRFRTVCFGVAASAFLATRVVNQVADDNEKDYPLAASVLKNNFYVDDCLFSAPTLEEVISAKKQLEDLLGGAGMQLSKFRTNRVEVLKPEDGSATDHSALVLDEEAKTLGILWNPRTDSFHFRVSSKLDGQNPTKRYLLSTIARIFDPCGLIAPITSTAKIILQKVWMRDLDWDDPLPEDLKKEWHAFVTDLCTVDQIRIPRWISTIRNPIHRELHAFCDASMAAYGVAIYLICEDEHQQRSSSLILAKAKLMPPDTQKEKPQRPPPKRKQKDPADEEMEPLTIPKAELTGAEFATQVLPGMSKTLGIEDCYYWTDNTGVLYQINSSKPHKDVYTRNRITKIRNASTPSQWRHVPSLENPADVLSRGGRVRTLCSDDLWWHGPIWVTQAKDQWPAPFDPHKPIRKIPDIVDCLATSTSTATNEPEDESNESDVESKEADVEPCIADTQPAEVSLTTSTLWIYDQLVKNCKSWQLIVRSIARFRRAVICFKRGTVCANGVCFKRKCRVHGDRVKLPSTAPVFPEYLYVKEMHEAETQFLKWAQEKHMPDVVALVRKNRQNLLPQNMRILRPFLDEEGLMRVGGRMDRADARFDMRHQIIVPKGDLSHMLMVQEHCRLLHAGPQLTFFSLRRRYWPICGLKLAKRVARKCVKCIRMNPPSSEQLMGNLPPARVNFKAPFAHTGVDFTGHIMIKRNPRGTVLEKAYVAIFVCMATRAGHFEVVTALSTEAFLAAFIRFISRRGIPEHMYSDNGKNFVGANKELRNMLRDHATQRRLADFSAGLHIQWHFNPPGAPHQGGLWEAAVRSFKKHFLRVVGKVRLTYEELNTVVIQIEAVLNSRPLFAISSHPNDPHSLCPGDFLTWGAPTQLPLDRSNSINLNRLQRFQLCNKLRKDVAVGWKRDYIHNLQLRQRWNKDFPNFTPGDVVLVKMEGVSNLDWPLGLVEEVHPGTDGKVRVVKVRANGKTYERDITKLVKLPVEDDGGA